MFGHEAILGLLIPFIGTSTGAANCDEFVNKLPQGYDTPIGENGAKLSGGEHQRISIVRALLKDAPIVLLDEATASLDVENETKVQGEPLSMPHCYCGELRLIYNGKVMLRNEVDVAFAEYATNGKSDNILHGKKYNASM